MTRDELLKYAKQTYGVEPDFPWPSYPVNAVLRNRKRKWFGLFMRVPYEKLQIDKPGLVDAINVKLDPLLIVELRKEPGIYPAYHMNKEHWVTVLLDGTVSADKVKNLLSLSYELVTERNNKKL